MKFKTIEDAITECRKHLHDTTTVGTEVESRLAAYLLVLISAQFEVRIEGIIEAYANRIADKCIRALVIKYAREKLRAPAVSSLTGFLRALDDNWGDGFRKKAGDQAIAAYDSIISNRHDFVHDARCNVTISDLEGYFHNSAGIFSALVATLGLRAHEVAHLY
jgi:RiboL-PSP-HEPN